MNKVIRLKATTKEKEFESISELVAKTSLLNEHKIYFWVWNVGEQMLQFDEGLSKELGLVSTTRLERIISPELIHVEDRLKWRRFIVCLRNNLNVESIEVRMFSTKNKFKWYKISAHTTISDKKRYGFIYDINDTKIENQVVEKRALRYKLLLQNNSGFNVVIDRDLIIKEINNSGLILKNIDKPQLIGTPVTDLFEHNFRLSFNESFYECLSTPNHEVRITISTNPLITTYTRKLELILRNKLHDDYINGVIVDGRDITEYQEIQLNLIKQKEEYKKLIKEYKEQNQFIEEKVEELTQKNQQIKEFNEKLITSENRFLTLAQKVDQAITIYENSKCIFISSRLAELTGYPLDELQEKRICDLAIVDSQKSVVKQFDNFFCGNIHQEEINFWAYTKHRKRKYFRNILYTQHVSPSVKYTYIITSDDTKIKLQTELLYSNQLKLKTTLESLQKYIFVIDKSGFLNEIYKPVKDILNINEDISKYIGKHYTNLPFSERMLKKIFDIAILTQKNKKRYSFELEVDFNGQQKWLWFNLSTRTNSAGEDIGWSLVVDDISKLKQTQVKLQDRDLQLFSLIENFPDIVVMKDSNAKWLMANNKICRLYSINNNVYKGKTTNDIFKLSNCDVSIYKEDILTDYEVISRNTVVKYEKTFCDIDNKCLIYEITKSPIFDQNHKLKSIIMIGHDITNRERYSREMKLAKEKAEKADDLKTAFLTNMSHELRTPLNGILGFTQLMQDSNITEEKRREYLEIIQKSGNSLLNIVSDVLDISKIQSNDIELNLSNVNIYEIVNKLYKHWKTLNINDAVKLNLKLCKNTNLCINADFDKVYQAINNLLSNAFKFTSKGQVTIILEELPTHVIVKVKDTGIGISKNDFNTIFEPFSQVEKLYARQFGGAGLGLAIAKEFITAMNGEIELNSKLGVGSTFTVKFPIVRN